MNPRPVTEGAVSQAVDGQNIVFVHPLKISRLSRFWSAEGWTDGPGGRARPGPTVTVLEAGCSWTRKSASPWHSVVIRQNHHQWLRPGGGECLWRAKNRHQQSRARPGGVSAAIAAL
jgi:hypothetical protein